MSKSLKIILGLIVTIVVVITFYLEAESKNDFESNVKTFSPTIKIIGREMDTAYLYADYKDPGAEYLYDSTASLDCNRYRLVTRKTGEVNTRIVGVYYITYYADDTLGNPLSPQTRTVAVVENKAGSLNGAYNVSFSQTVTATDTKKGTISSGTYTALITPASKDGHINLYSLHVGPERLFQDVYLFTDSLEINCFTTDYLSLEGSGKLDRATGSFTIETVVYPFYPKVVYKCSNVFIPQLVLTKQLVFLPNSSKER